MPTYEYLCKKCGEFEVEQRISEDVLKTCPNCKGKNIQRLISATAFHLKGGGWYKDLYSSTNKSEVKSDSVSGSETKTDAKASANKAKESAKSTEVKPKKESKKTSKLS
jgi:putative FmdB family regulatory protein